MISGFANESLTEYILITIIGSVYLYGFAMNKNWAYHLLKHGIPRSIARVLGFLVGLAFFIIGIEGLFNISRIFSI